MMIEKIWVLELESEDTTDNTDDDNGGMWLATDVEALKQLPIVREYLWDNADIPRIPRLTDCVLLIEDYTEDYQYLIDYFESEGIPFAHIYSLDNQSYLLQQAIENSKGKVKKIDKT